MTGEEEPGYSEGAEQASSPVPSAAARAAAGGVPPACASPSSTAWQQPANARSVHVIPLMKTNESSARAAQNGIVLRHVTVQ
jgi:hypothetical protein